MTEFNVGDRIRTVIDFSESEEGPDQIIEEVIDYDGNFEVWDDINHELGTIIRYPAGLDDQKAEIEFDNEKDGKEHHWYVSIDFLEKVPRLEEEVLKCSKKETE